jgi:multidrug transporter EmrE-like cation transporter
MALEVPPPEALQPVASGDSGSSTLFSLMMLVTSVVFAVAGQITLKTAMNEVGRIGATEIAAAGDTITRAIREPRLWLGLVLFGISAVFWLVVLSRVDLSVAYPFVGLSYIVVVLFSRLFLHEQVGAVRWLGVVVVAVGIAIIGFSFRGTTGS